MTPRLDHISIRNFKACREFELALDGRHLLAYGPNGSGKSSIYWALYTFLQSAAKKPAEVAKYFDPGHQENLLNFHEQAEQAPRPGELVVTFRNSENGAKTSYAVGHGGKHETANSTEIRNADLASDFLSYRFFSRFSDFRNPQEFNIWPLFEKEILPFCSGPVGQPAQPMWDAVRSGNANPSSLKGRAAAQRYEKFATNTQAFADVLQYLVDTIGAQAQAFYDAHFKAGDAQSLSLKMVLRTPPKFTGNSSANSRFSRPEILLDIATGSTRVPRPQSFLNEAKLTQVALAIRFAASKVKLQHAGIKLLVLDDLLLSLDMSNRMKVVDILLSSEFADFQKIIFTHDRGFFKEFRRAIGANHPHWYLGVIEGSAQKDLRCRRDKTPVQEAEEFLHGRDLELAGVKLRKAAEDAAARLNEVLTGKKSLSEKPPNLSEDLKTARRNLVERIPLHLYSDALRDIPEHLRVALPAPDDADLDVRLGISDVERAALKKGRAKLRELITRDHSQLVRNVQLIDAVLDHLQRVLNPAAHEGEAPLYETEVQSALELITKLVELPETLRSTPPAPPPA